MLLVMALNLVIFFTLFSGLNTMASYKISYNYDNLKYTYANCLNVVDNYFGGNYEDKNKLEVFKNYQNLNKFSRDPNFFEENTLPQSSVFRFVSPLRFVSNKQSDIPIRRHLQKKQSCPI